MPKKRPSKKEVHNLWWKYLRASEKYKEWCKKSRKNQKGYTWREQWLVAHLEGKEANPFYAMYIFWGDIFSRSFDKWWTAFNKKARGDIGLFHHIIDSEFADAIDRFHSEHKKNPSLYEFQEEFKARIKANPWKIYLAIFPERGQDVESLVSKFTTVVRQEIKKRRKHLTGTLITRFKNRLRYDEAEHYLDVYNRAAKLKGRGQKWMEELFKHYYPHILKELSEKNLSENKEDDKKADELETRKGSLIQQLHRDIRNAREIIENVEKGFPPFKYGSEVKYRK